MHRCESRSFRICGEREREEIYTSSKKYEYERESVRKIFGERFKISLWRFTRTNDIFINIILRTCI